jgi:hypothetical protein
MAMFNSYVKLPEGNQQYIIIASPTEPIVHSTLARTVWNLQPEPGGLYVPGPHPGLSLTATLTEKPFPLILTPHK